MEDEKLCLKWNDFQKNLPTSFGELRGDSDFTDVTLVCEEQSIKAHKVILSASSPFFKKLLKTHSHPQPLIYMRGIRSSELCAIIDFIYLGEARIFQEQLETFLALAEELELNGLEESFEDGGAEEQRHEQVKRSSLSLSSNLDLKPEKYSNQDQQKINLKTARESLPYKIKHEGIKNDGILMPIKQQQSKYDGTLTKQQPKKTVDIDPVTAALVESMFERKDLGFACNHCEYTSKKGHKDHMREHVEKHIGGLEYPCNYCNKVLSSSISFRKHLQRHSGEKPNRCNLCDFASSWAGNLRKHMKTHNGEMSNKSTN